MNADGITPLIMALGRRESEMVKILIAHPRVDVNLPTPNKVTPLFLVCSQGYPDQAELLIGPQSPVRDKIKVNEDEVGESALIGAVSKRSREIVELLLQHPDIDVNITEKQLGMTALYVACEVFIASYFLCMVEY